MEPPARAVATLHRMPAEPPGGSRWLAANSLISQVCEEDLDSEEDFDCAYSDYESEEKRSSADGNEDEHDYGEQSPFTENRVTNVEAIPSKRPFEDTATGTHENPTTQLGSGAQRGDELALRRLILDEKAQLIEMYRLGIFTKEEFLVRLDKIEAHYDAMRPPPTKRARLSN